MTDGVQIVFETHAISEDNDAGVATGWLPGRLSVQGRALAAELGRRRAADGLAAVFSSDLGRAVETTTIAFGDTLPTFLDWRLRECDYGDWNGHPRAQVHDRRGDFLDRPYPGGESWREATARVAGFLDDLPARWAGRRILVVGHVATRWALDEALAGVALERSLAEEFSWRPGWEYVLRPPAGPGDHGVSGRNRPGSAWNVSETP